MVGPGTVPGDHFGPTRTVTPPGFPPSTAGHPLRMATTTGDYGSLRSTIDALVSEAARALYEQGGSDTDQAKEYARSAGEGMRTYFDPWLDVPDPAAFRSLSTSLVAAMERLNVGLETETTNDTVDDDGQPNRVAGNETLQAVSSNAAVFATFNGEAVLAFRDYFINNFDDRVSAQYCTAVDVRSALEVMAAVWEEARSNVAGIAEEALALTKTLPGGNGSASASLDLLGIVASVAGLFPPLSVASSLTGIGISVMGQVEGDPTTTSVEVTDLYHVSEFISTSLQAVSSQLATAELAVADHLRAYSTAMSAHPQRFSLQPARRFFDEDRPDRLVPRYDREDAREMKAQPAAMVRYSHDMEDGAGVLERAASLVRDVHLASTYDNWSRQGVGMAPAAGMYDFDACVTGLADMIEETATNTRDAAVHLRGVAKLFVATDEGVRGAMDELQRHERAIEKRLWEEEHPQPPEWPGGRPPHIVHPGMDLL